MPLKYQRNRKMKLFKSIFVRFYDEKNKGKHLLYGRDESGSVRILWLARNLSLRSDVRSQKSRLGTSLGRT